MRGSLSACSVFIGFFSYSSFFKNAVTLFMIFFCDFDISKFKASHLFYQTTRKLVMYRLKNKILFY